MKRTIVLVVALILAFAATPALAESGHFIESGANAPVCTDVGTTVECEGKVSGLGGTTFEITVLAEGTASLVCANPGQNTDVPGQRGVVTSGSTGVELTPTNGQYTFTGADVSTAEPTVAFTCPNAKWTQTVTDVVFTEATLTLFEDGAVSDSVTVAVQ